MDEDLKKIGLTWNEIKVYKSLLKLGETAVGGIINDLKVHRQIAYNALEALEKKEMVIEKVKNGVRHFKVANPDLIVENAQKKELAARRLSQNIKKELKKSRHEHEINIFNGQSGAQKFYTQAFKSMPIGATVYVMGVGIDDYEKSLGEKFISGVYNKLKTGKKIYSKLVVSEAMRKSNEDYEKKVNPEFRETRYLPYENLNPIATNIWPDRISFMSSGSEIFIIEIINMKFRNSYKEHFDLLWKIAKK